MSHKSKKIGHSMANRFRNATTFYEQLKLALEFYDQHELLEQYSPLAKPYFLHQRHNRLDRDFRTIRWGAILSNYILEAAIALWGKPLPTETETLLQEIESHNRTGNQYHFFVLELNFFNKIYRPIPRNQADIYNDILHIGRSTHDRHLREAIEQLGKMLLLRLQPAIRLESPQMNVTVFGRRTLKQQCKEILDLGQCVSLVGASGIGKTTAAATLAQEWLNTTEDDHSSVFWFTFRSEFNDNLESLLFALGYFLHQQGASGLWLQLVASEGAITDINLTLGLTRSDLDMLGGSALLCFDEVEQLNANEVNHLSQTHHQLQFFLESLRGYTPMLFIGQQAVIETEATLELDRLSNDEIVHWLQNRGIDHQEADVQQIAEYTQGNPRLILLCLAYHASLSLSPDAPFSDTILRLPNAPGLVPIWKRLRRQLSSVELTILYEISAFRIPAPKDAWLNNDDVENGSSTKSCLKQLEDLRLISSTAVDGLSVLPTLQHVIYAEMSVEQKESCHLKAAQVYAYLGESTEMAYHFVKAEHIELAVQLWYDDQDVEVKRGLARSARIIFDSVSINRLPNKLQRKLSLIRSRLYQLIGDPDQSIQALEQANWSTKDLLGTDAYLLWAQSLGTRGDTTHAQKKLDEGIEYIAELEYKRTRFHAQYSISYLQERNLDAAREQATKARLRTELLQGAIESQSGNYRAAQRHSQFALELALQIEDYRAVGRAYYYQAIAAMHQNEHELAFGHYQNSLEMYQRIGDQVREAEVRSNLAGNYLVAGRYQQAIECAEISLEFFQKINSSYWCANNANNIAESYFELGEIEKAEEYAIRTMSYEEAHFFPYGLYTMASVRSKQGRLDEARSLYEQSVQIAEENEDRFLLAHGSRALGKVYAEMGVIDKAKEKLNNALKLFQQMKVIAEVTKTQKLINKVQ